MAHRGPVPIPTAKREQQTSVRYNSLQYFHGIWVNSIWSWEPIPTVLHTNILSSHQFTFSPDLTVLSFLKSSLYNKEPPSLLHVYNKNRLTLLLNSWPTLPYAGNNHYNHLLTGIFNSHNCKFYGHFTLITYVMVNKNSITHQRQVTSKIENSCKLSISILIPKQINTTKSAFSSHFKILTLMQLKGHTSSMWDVANKAEESAIKTEWI